MGGRKDGREGAIPLGSGKGQRKVGIRKRREDIEVALGDQHCFSLSSGCGASLRSENIPHRVSPYSKDTLSLGVSLERIAFLNSLQD